MVKAYIGKTVIVTILHASLHQSHLVGKSQEIIESASLSHRAHRQCATGILQFIGACTRLRHTDRCARYHDTLEIGHGDVGY